MNIILASRLILTHNIPLYFSNYMHFSNLNSEYAKLE